MDAAEEKGMIWGKFKKDGNHIYFWSPNYDRFSDLANKGLLPGHPYAGESDDGDILVLSDLKAEHMKLITSDSKGVLFDWEYPFFMVRLSDDIN